MSDKIEVNGGNSIGLSSILTIIFVIAKLAGVINWSWWVVFAPVIISTALILAVLGVVLAAAAVAVYFGVK